MKNIVMNDDLQGDDERRLYALFIRLRQRVVHVSDRFATGLRRRLHEASSAEYPPADPTRAVGTTLTELVNVAGRLLAWGSPSHPTSAPSPPERPSPPAPESDR